MTGSNASLAPNDSFWMEAIDSRHLEPPLQGKHEADVVLVGGGYTSLVAAYFLKKLLPERLSPAFARKRAPRLASPLFLDPPRTFPGEAPRLAESKAHP